MAANGSRREFSNVRSMKSPGLTPHLLSATLFLVAASAGHVSAQETMATTPSAKAAKRGEELLKRFDKNRDGKLDDDERADAKEEMMKETIDRQMQRVAAVPGGLERFRTQALEMFDKNRDGRLDEEERAAAQKFAESRTEVKEGMDDLAKRFDQNGDGRIGPEERAQIDAYVAELRALSAGPAGPARTEPLRWLDQTANAPADDTEMVALANFVREKVETSPAQLRRYDRNGNGKLEDGEWVVARLAIARWLHGGQNAAMGLEIPPTPEQEKRRLEAVAAEVARRRAERGEAPKPQPPAK
jgi:Ca2+-binding EF-hand superfamily protein